jgi:hypothetical protein
MSDRIHPMVDQIMHDQHRVSGESGPDLSVRYDHLAPSGVRRSHRNTTKPLPYREYLAHDKRINECCDSARRIQRDEVTPLPDQSRRIAGPWNEECSIEEDEAAVLGLPEELREAGWELRIAFVRDQLTFTINGNHFLPAAIPDQQIASCIEVHAEDGVELAGSRTFSPESKRSLTAGIEHKNLTLRCLTQRQASIIRKHPARWPVELGRSAILSEEPIVKRG